LDFNPDNSQVFLHSANPEDRHPRIGVRRVVSKAKFDTESNRRAFCPLLEAQFQIPGIFYRLKVPSRLRLLIGL
jgi:hypothetical protein